MENEAPEEVVAPLDLMPDEVQEAVKDVVSEPKSRSLKETKEVFKALESLTEFLEKTFADGQVNGSDFMHLLGLLNDLETFSAAIKDADEVGAELKDLDEAEIMELAMMSYNLVKKAVAAVKSKGK